MSSVDSETGFKDPAGDESVEATPVGGNASSPAGSLPPLGERQQRALARITEMVIGAAKGELPLERELRPGEPQKLSPVHIQMCIDRATGLSVAEIAARHEYSYPRTSAILLSPHAQTLISTMLSAAADRVQDIGERLEALAPEALNVKVEILRHSKSDNLRNKIADDILDRAGYGSRKQVDINSRGVLVLPASQAASLGAVLEESQLVATLDYSAHLSTNRPSVESHSPSSDGALQQSAGQHLVAAAPPVAGPRALSLEETSEKEEKDWAADSRRMRIA
jgi:hypothetical protein